VLVVGVLAGASFAIPAHVLPDAPAAAVGLLVYAGGLLMLRSHGLEDAWAYVRALH
jgi:hypothetical protein